jgi:hypothetical protein
MASTTPLTDTASTTFTDLMYWAYSHRMALQATLKKLSPFLDQTFSRGWNSIVNLDLIQSEIATY